MKKIREFLHSIVTAVICLAMSIAPGKKLSGFHAKGQAAAEYLWGCGYAAVTLYTGILEKLSGRPGKKALSLSETQVYYADFTAGSKPHGRSPDAGPRGHDAVQAAFFKIAAGVFPHKPDGEISGEGLTVMGMSG